MSSGDLFTHKYNYNYICGIDYDYDDYYCDGCYGCESNDDYCRDSQYYGLKCKIDIQTFVEYEFKKEPLLTQYCIQKYLQYMNFDDEDYWEVKTCGGYYGEEIAGIYFHGDYNKIKADVDNIISMSDIDKFNSVMALEYGEGYTPYKSVELETINLKDLTIPNKGYLGLIEPKETPDKWPVCIVEKVGKSNKYKLIDGYHRFKNNKNKNIKVLVVQ